MNRSSRLRRGPRVAALLTMVMCVALAGAGCKDPSGSYSLAWEDNFEGPAGQTPDSTKWRFDEGGDGWGNSQLEFNTARRENAALDGTGNLAIVARKELYQGNPYTSARLSTRGLFEQAYGKFEARIKLPVGQGIWPAFWLLGNNIGTIGWPRCGEIDIMEFKGQDTLRVYGSAHGPGYSGGAALTRVFESAEEGLNADFHVFAIQWDPDRITWTVDGRIYQVRTKKDLPGGAPWVFDHPFFILLNLAVGGTFVGSPDPNTTRFPQTMLVDWVRVYRGEL